MSTAQRVLMQPAYVLHQRAYRDTSAILELFTPEHGRIGVIARGARGNKPRWRGLLQTFQPLLVSWSQRGELGLLTAAEAQGGALTIIPGYIASGFYLNEILLRLLQRHEAQLELFGGYDAALRELASLGVAENDTTRLEITLRRFEMRLLAALGYGLLLEHEAHSVTPIQTQQQYAYHLEQGPSLAGAQDDPHSVACVSGQTLLDMQADDWATATTRKEAKQLLRAVLAHYLGPKPLQSRQLMQQSAQLSQRRSQSETAQNTPETTG